MFNTGGEDWDLWMCLAAAGHHGGTLPELLYWFVLFLRFSWSLKLILDCNRYRVNDPSFRNDRWGNSFGDGFLDLRAKIFVSSSFLSLAQH